MEWSTQESLPLRCDSAYLFKQWRPGRLVPNPAHCLAKGWSSNISRKRIAARAIEPYITEIGRNNQFWLVPEALGVLVEALISP